MGLSQFLFRGALLSIVVMLSACATQPESPVPVPETKKPQDTVIVPPKKVPEEPFRSTTPSASAAWKPLLAQAQQASDRGDYEQALALLERAQRIDPDSAEVYLGMARTHQARGDAAQAKATAERGLLYCSGSIQCDALRAYIR